jgi:hypothetical protein
MKTLYNDTLKQRHVEIIRFALENEKVRCQEKMNQAEQKEMNNFVTFYKEQMVLMKEVDEVMANTIGTKR